VEGSCLVLSGEESGAGANGGVGLGGGHPESGSPGEQDGIPGELLATRWTVARAGHDRRAPSWPPGRWRDAAAPETVSVGGNPCSDLDQRRLDQRHSGEMESWRDGEMLSGSASGTEQASQRRRVPGRVGPTPHSSPAPRPRRPRRIGPGSSLYARPSTRPTPRSRDARRRPPPTAMGAAHWATSAAVGRGRLGAGCGRRLGPDGSPRAPGLPARALSARPGPRLRPSCRLARASSLPRATRAPMLGCDDPIAPERIDALWRAGRGIPEMSERRPGA